MSLSVSLFLHSRHLACANSPVISSVVLLFPCALIVLLLITVCVCMRLDIVASHSHYQRACHSCSWNHFWQCVSGLQQEHCGSAGCGVGIRHLPHHGQSLCVFACLLSAVCHGLLSASILCLLLPACPPDLFVFRRCLCVIVASYVFSSRCMPIPNTFTARL